MKSRSHSSKTDDDGQGLFTNEHRAAIERIRDTGQYIMFSRQFFKLGLDLASSVVLQDMINFGAMVWASTRKGWFTYTVKNMEERCGLKRDVQQRVIHILIANKLIKVEKRGNPAKRHVWVDLIRIENRLSRIILKEQNTPSKRENR